jgi:tight adherence protein C
MLVAPVIGLLCTIGAFIVLERLVGDAARREAVARVGSYGRDQAPATVAAAGKKPALPAVLRSKAALAVSLGLLGLLVGQALKAPAATTVLVVACFALAGTILPQSVVRARTRRRTGAILMALPDTLDLLAVAVRAGLGLESAIAKIAEVTNGPLAEELAIVLTEIRIGESRQNALDHLAKRLDAPEVTALVRSLIQAEQLGAPLAETLATRAAEARRRRFLATEEKAGRAPVKMLFPTVLFIFPALFVVILAPALLVLTKSL